MALIFFAQASSARASCDFSLSNAPFGFVAVAYYRLSESDRLNDDQKRRFARISISDRTSNRLADLVGLANESAGSLRNIEGHLPGVDVANAWELILQGTSARRNGAPIYNYQNAICTSARSAHLIEEGLRITLEDMPELTDEFKPVIDSAARYEYALTEILRILGWPCEGLGNTFRLQK